MLLKQLGCELHVATMSLGDAGSLEHPPSEIRRIRRAEAEESCRRLGASYRCAGFSDFAIFDDDVSNRRTTALVREIDPWLVITHPPQDYMSDHENTSRLVRNACFAAPAPNYDTLSYAGSLRSSGIPYLYYTQPVENRDIFGRVVRPQFYVDISNCISKKEELLGCHASQRRWLQSHHGMDEYLESMRRWGRELAEDGSQLSAGPIRYAEGFRQHLGHPYPQDNILGTLLPDWVVLETRA
jgi:LmbE family N-acetylglucosaminyl deacetylase